LTLVFIDLLLNNDEVVIFDMNAELDTAVVADLMACTSLVVL